MMRAYICSALLFVVLGSSAQSQIATGTPPFNSFGGGPFDTVNLGNLNVHISIPILHKEGRGRNFYYDISNDNSVWTPVTSSGTTSWTPDSTWGWQSQTDAATGFLKISSVTVTSTFCTINGVKVHELLTATTYGGFVDRLGTFHHVSNMTNTEYCTGSGSAYTGASGTADDGSGYRVFIPPTTGLPPTTATVTARNGGTWTLSPTYRLAAGTSTDPNGNQITAQVASGQTTLFDTLSSTTALLTIAGTAPNPVTYTYDAPTNGSAKATITYKAYTVQTFFQCANIKEYGPTSSSLVDKITLSDGSFYQFEYETTPISGSTNVTGRIASITLPTGGTISYSYAGAHDGVNCSDGSTVALNRTLNPGGEWQYVRTQQSDSAKHWQTKITTPPDAQNQQSAGDDTVIDFQEDNATVTPPTLPSDYFFETQRKIYQGSSSSGTLLATLTKCYNAKYANCATTSVSSPITQLDSYSQPSGGTSRLSEVKYNANGLVTDDREYDYGATTGSAPGTTHLILETTTSYGSYNGSSCAQLGNGIVSKPCQIIVSDWSSGAATTISSTSFSYDETAVTQTSGTPQHIAISGSRGNLTTVKIQTSSSGSVLSKKASYYDTGTLNVTTDVNGSQTTYVYSSAVNPYNSAVTASCGNSFPTTINEPLSLSRSLQWRCVGGVAGQVTDENGDNSIATYTDPNFWRPFSLTDQLSNQTNLAYSATTVEAALQNFNGGNSSADSLTTVDGFGRPAFAQRKQAPASDNYDTTETDYNNLGQPYRFTMPYTATASPSSQNNTVAATTKTYDALGRVLTITDADGGTVSYTYTANDVLQQASGGQTFSKQFEYDGLGRLTSVCEITPGTSTWPGGTCAQTSTQTGYWTKYTYDALGRLLTVAQNAQAASGSQQTRSFTYDWLGRMLTESNPETANSAGNNGQNGTIHYTYDSVSPCADGTNYSYPGDLVQKQDNAGNYSCYKYDGLHRLVQAGNTAASNTILRKFAYDSESSYPTGVSVSYGKTHVVEAQTVNTSALSTVVTDEFFSYDRRGNLTDVYESTPHSGGYYHITAGYWPTGVLETLSLLNSSGSALIPAQTYGVDSEGRTNSVSAASGQNPVTTVTYSTGSSTAPLGALTNVTFGSADSDAFTYDPNTGRMATYSFTANGKADLGTLTWNANGTLGKLVINDQIPGTSDSGTCTYGYDDERRISNVTCGTFWVQNFSYDPFGNIVKNVPPNDGGGSFLPSYWTSPPTNQFLSLPGATPQYDANGNLLKDNLNTYTWDAIWGTMASVTPSGGSTVSATYDALGRMVENSAGGSYSEFVYSPTGIKLAKCNGQTLVKAFIALPGGAKAIYNASGLAYYRHSDWIGSSRLTTTASRAMYSSSAYAPFGEQYSTAGTADASFTGQDQDTVGNLYDFPARRQSSSQGRWISPDPAGRGAVVLTNPQSWNRYAYALNNPLALIDPKGTDTENPDPSCDPEIDGGGDGCGGNDPGGGDGGGDNGGDNSGGGCDPTIDPTCDDNSGDNSGDPNQNCDQQCQANQALQNAALAMLTNSNCAALIGGPSPGGQAAAIGAVAGQLFGNPNPFIQFNAGPDSSVPSSAYAITSSVPVPVNLGGPTPVLMPGAQITLGPNFYNPPAGAVLPPGGVAQDQTNGILEEFGHAEGFLNAAGGYAYPNATGIMMDNPTNLSSVSVQNGQNVQAACDQGGNVPTQTSQVDGIIQ
jgi:RHS repeat-associated protein